MKQIFILFLVLIVLFFSEILSQTNFQKYGGNDGIGMAISNDGINWEEFEGNPILINGDPGTWDAVGYLEPSNILFDGLEYKMWYTNIKILTSNGSVYKLETRIGYARSNDGINWIKDTINNPVLVPGDSTIKYNMVWRPWVSHEDTIYKMWFVEPKFIPELNIDVFKIRYAESLDGINWDKSETPILEEGDFTTWANDVDGPCVIYDDNLYHMWYTSTNTFGSGSEQQVKYITSVDGINWDSTESITVLNPGTNNNPDPGIWTPMVVKEGDFYRMWYTGFGDSYSICYAEDFSNLLHADSIMIDTNYTYPGDVFMIKASIINVEGHDLTAQAIIVSDDGSIIDTSRYLNDMGLIGDWPPGDGIYTAKYWSIAEKNYTIGIRTIDEVTGFTRNGLNWNITNRFTSKGPIILENLSITSTDTIWNPGERIKFNLTLKNLGKADTVYNVNVNLISDDSTIVETTIGKPRFGDIPPGESLTSSYRDFALSLNKGTDSTTFGEHEVKLEILSSGEKWWTDTFTIIVNDLTDIKDDSHIPIIYSLSQNYPNPFNPSTTIAYSIPKQSNVTVKVFDVLGREVTTLVNKAQSQGDYEVEFDGTDLTSGIYFYRLQAVDFAETKKMILIK